MDTLQYRRKLVKWSCLSTVSYLNSTFILESKISLKTIGKIFLRARKYFLTLTNVAWSISWFFQYISVQFWHSIYFKRQETHGISCNGFSKIQNTVTWERYHWWALLSNKTDTVRNQWFGKRHGKTISYQQIELGLSGYCDNRFVQQGGVHASPLIGCTRWYTCNFSDCLLKVGHIQVH